MTIEELWSAACSGDLTTLRRYFSGICELNRRYTKIDNREDDGLPPMTQEELASEQDLINEYCYLAKQHGEARRKLEEATRALSEAIARLYTIEMRLSINRLESQRTITPQESKKTGGNEP